jgi:hypothetical protein
MNPAVEREVWKNSGNTTHGANSIDVVAMPVLRIERNVCTLNTIISKLFHQNKFILWN